MPIASAISAGENSATGDAAARRTLVEVALWAGMKAQAQAAAMVEALRQGPARALPDPDGVIVELKRVVRPYPPLLRAALVSRFLFEAGFSLDGATKGAARGDVVYVAGCLFRTIAALVQVLYALHERYCLNEKGALAEAATFERTPPGWVATTTGLLAAPGATPAVLEASVATARALVDAVRALAV
jgi:hypothetical protein